MEKSDVFSILLENEGLERYDYDDEGTTRGNYESNDTLFVEMQISHSFLFLWYTNLEQWKNASDLTSLSMSLAAARPVEPEGEGHQGSFAAPPPSRRVEHRGDWLDG